MPGLREKADKGITLLEILLGLVITGVMLSLMLRIYLDQYRLTSEAIKKAETRFAVFKAGQVLTSALSNAEKASLVTEGVLRVEYTRDEELITDYFYLDDKDLDGRLDLYRDHSGVTNPIVTGISSLNLKKCQGGLWEIEIHAGRGSEASEWQSKVRQRLWRE